MPRYVRELNCPRCMSAIRVPAQVDQFLTCKVCSYAIPLAYIRDYREIPPIFVQLFGLTEAGKTTFLDMLRLHLYSLDRAWSEAGFFAQPITQLDMDHKVILLTERERGNLAGSTPKRDRDQNEVYIMALKHMMRWGSRTLVLMDHSGESFGPMIIDTKEVPFLQHAPATIMLFSLPDLEHEGKRVDDLITSYITTLETYKVNLAREHRQLVVVFTKADLLANLPRELNEYLSRDNIYDALRDSSYKLDNRQLEYYLKWMNHISGLTRQWVKNSVPGGNAMLSMLNDKHISACFTVMSATGQPLANGVRPLPRRVLDPFFWVLEFYKQNSL